MFESQPKALNIARPQYLFVVLCASLEEPVLCRFLDNLNKLKLQHGYYVIVLRLNMQHWLKVNRARTRGFLRG